MGGEWPTKWPTEAVAWVPVSVDVMEDRNEFGAALARNEFGAALARGLRRLSHPWEFPDRPAIRWTFEPFPRLTRLVARFRR